MGNLITLFVITIVVVIAIAIGFFSLQAVRNSRKIAEIGATASFDIGRYMGGLPGNALPTAREAPIKCAVTMSDFVFIVFGSVLGIVPRDAVACIHLDDRGERLCYLTIDWQDERPVQQQTIFEFSGRFARILANAAAEQLQKYVKPRVRRLAQDEKKCPFCAEVIKSEARICRHCGRDLPPPGWQATMQRVH